MSEMSGPSADSGSATAPTGTGQPSAASGQVAGAPEHPPPGKASAPSDGGLPPAGGGQVAGAAKLAEPGKASVPTDTDPLSAAGSRAAGIMKLSEPGKASVPGAPGPLQAVSGPAEGIPKPTLPGKATVLALSPGAKVAVPGSPALGGETEPGERRSAGSPSPPDPAGDDLHLRRFSAPREQSESAPDVKVGNTPRFDVAAAFRNLQNRARDAAKTPRAGSPGMLREAQERWLRDAKPDALADAILNRDKSAAGHADPPAPATAPAVNAPRTGLDGGKAAAAPRVTSIDQPSSGGWLVTFDQPVTVGQTEQLLWPGGVPDAVQVLPDAPERIQLTGLNYEAVERMAPEAFDRLVFDVRRPRR